MLKYPVMDLLVMGHETQSGLQYALISLLLIEDIGNPSLGLLLIYH